MSKSKKDSLPTMTPVTAPTLEHIRAESMRQRANATLNTAQTISQLEAWRDEIEATIAFLKAQQRK